MADITKLGKLLKGLATKADEADLLEKAKKIEENVADSERRISEWAKEKGLPYREKTTPYAEGPPATDYDPSGKLYSPAEESLKKEKQGWLDEVEKAKKSTPGDTNVLGIGAGAAGIAALSEENEDFISKLKRGLKEKYSELEDWERRGREARAEERRRIDKEFLGTNYDERGSEFGMSPEEYDQLIQDIGMSSPAMGAAKALKAAPDLVKFLKKK
ncbi:MAG: hypothetical protein RLZZ181_596 [Pseudomonadota bacterium]|jgi:hypothetical protein